MSCKMAVNLDFLSWLTTMILVVNIHLVFVYCVLVY